MPTYKLTYFDITALGELIRFLFSYGDIKFEDVRVKEGQWPSLKPKTPWGTLPVVEIDGQKVTQSLAIARYLAAEVGLLGKDDLEELFINEAVDIINDVRLRVAGVHYEPNEELRAKKYEQLHGEYFPFVLPKLEKIVKDNGGYFAVGRVTLADIYFTSIMKYLNFIARITIVDGYPHLRQVLEKVESIPNIKKWLQKRPQTLK